MKDINLAKRVKELRSRKGLSQEQLADESGLSLRTIQRIERGETEPRGDTLKRLSNTFNLSPEEIMDWTVPEDKGFLLLLNLSAFCFLLFPLLGIIIPLVMWVSKKDKLKDVNQTGREILNFQISWTIVLFLSYLYFFGMVYYRIYQTHEISIAAFGNIYAKYVIWIVLYLYNIVLTTINTVRIHKGQKVKFIPKLKFLK